MFNFFAGERKRSAVTDELAESGFEVTLDFVNPVSRIYLPQNGFACFNSSNSDKALVGSD